MLRPVMRPADLNTAGRLHRQHQLLQRAALVRFGGGRQRGLADGDRDVQILQSEDELARHPRQRAGRGEIVGEVDEIRRRGRRRDRRRGHGAGRFDVFLIGPEIRELVGRDPIAPARHEPHEIGVVVCGACLGDLPVMVDERASCSRPRSAAVRAPSGRGRHPRSRSGSPRRTSRTSRKSWRGISRQEPVTAWYSRCLLTCGSEPSA